MNKHTPGPWTYQSGPNDPVVTWINGPGFESICDLYSRDRVGENLTLHPFPNAEANARLIAAAPELLDACQMVSDGPHDAEAIADMLPAIRAAIAKATGQ